MYYNKSREKFNHVEQLYEALSFSLDALKRFCVTHSMVRENACSNWNIEIVYHAFHWNTAMQIWQLQGRPIEQFNYFTSQSCLVIETLILWDCNSVKRQIIKKSLIKIQPKKLYYPPRTIISAWPTCQNMHLLTCQNMHLLIKK